jgi:hypothetical protein
MSAIKDMPTDKLAALIRAYVTGRGHDWNLIAAANLAADSEMVLWKIRQFIDDDGWIWWDKVAAHVDRSGWSSGEKGLIRLCCSLAREVPEDADPNEWALGTMLMPLDVGNARLAVEAVRYAAMGPGR